MELPALRVADRGIATPFGLLGTDENALSFALAYTLQQCPQLLQWFLGQVGIPGVYLSALGKGTITLQAYRRGEMNHGITDIEIRIPERCHLIVEAKIGLSVPSIEQCQKYLPRLIDSNEPTCKLVALVQSADLSFVQHYSKRDISFGDRLCGFHWTYFIPRCVHLIVRGGLPDHAQRAIRWFHSFLDREYRMKAFTTEVWILPVATEPLWPNGMSFQDIHREHKIYFDYRSHSVRPLYIGFRAGGKLDSVSRVVRIEHETPVSNYVPGLKTRWKDSLYTIWHLDDPVSLPKPIPSGKGLWQRRVACDFDLLLSCKSVLEIEKKMRERRGSATGESEDNAD